jgi:hypothetical protein
MKVLYQVIKEKKITILFVISIIILFLLTFYIYTPKKGFDPSRDKEYLLICKNKLYQSEIILADAIESKNSFKLKRLLKKYPDIISESYLNNNHYSLLHYCIDVVNYKATKILLKAGYNSNIQDKLGRTPLFYSTIDHRFNFLNKKLEGNKWISLFLEYGASPNICNNESKSPLINSINLEIFYSEESYIIPKLLIEKGKCDINIIDNSNHSAVYYSLYEGYIGLAHYLIVEHKADVTKEDILRSLLRKMIYPLDSEQYKLKMEIVEEFKKQGIDYFSEPIPEDVLEIIKEEYPDNWEEYVKVY